MSGTALVAGSITLMVKMSDGSPATNAEVWLAGPTPAWGRPDSTGVLKLDPLEAGSYEARVSAPGYVSATVPLVIVDPKTTITSTAWLERGASVTGRVLDGSGNPVAGARVAEEGTATLTRSDGTFQLDGAPTGTGTFTVAKGGFSTLSQSVSAPPAARDWTLAARPEIISLENPQDAYDTTTVGQALAPLATAATGAGFTWQPGAANATIRILAAPRTVSNASASALVNFVRQGGKLVLLGEWGGATTYNPGALNRAAMPFGLAFNPDLVRSFHNAGDTGWVQVPVTSTLPAVDAMSQGVTLFDGCSVFGAPGMWGLLTLGSGGYRIASTDAGEPYLAVARGVGAGLVACVGDTSAWTAGSITGNALGGANLGETNNRQFMLNLLRW